MLSSYSNLTAALRDVYLAYAVSSRQEKVLQGAIKDLFPNLSHLNNTRRCSGLLDHSETGILCVVACFVEAATVFDIFASTAVVGKRRYLELDVWIPELNMGFEYQVLVSVRTFLVTKNSQDPYHYTSAWFTNLSAVEYLH